MNTRALLVRDLFGSALDLPATERPAFLREACGEDASLLSEVADLLATTPTDDFLEPPELSEVLPPRPPSTLGPYQIDQIAECPVVEGHAVEVDLFHVVARQVGNRRGTFFGPHLITVIHAPNNVGEDTTGVGKDDP